MSAFRLAQRGQPAARLQHELLQRDFEPDHVLRLHDRDDLLRRAVDVASRRPAAPPAACSSGGSSAATLPPRSTRACRTTPAGSASGDSSAWISCVHPRSAVREIAGAGPRSRPQRRGRTGRRVREVFLEPESGERSRVWSRKCRIVRLDRPPKKLNVPLPAWQASRADCTSVRACRDLDAELLRAACPRTPRRHRAPRRRSSATPSRCRRCRWPGSSSSGRVASANSLPHPSATR